MSSDIPSKQDRQPACAGTDLDTWFPGENQARHSSEITAAKRVCKGCELMTGCLDWALRHEQHGIWAGTTETERRKMRREQGIVYVPLTFAELYGRADAGRERGSLEDDAA